jgi:hypothetical protein
VWWRGNPDLAVKSPKSPRKVSTIIGFRILRSGIRRFAGGFLRDMPARPFQGPQNSLLRFHGNKKAGCQSRTQGERRMLGRQKRCGGTAEAAAGRDGGGGRQGGHVWTPKSTECVRQITTKKKRSECSSVPAKDHILGRSGPAERTPERQRQKKGCANALGSCWQLQRSWSEAASPWELLSSSQSSSTNPQTPE